MILAARYLDSLKVRGWLVVSLSGLGLGQEGLLNIKLNTVLLPANVVGCHITLTKRVKRHVWTITVTLPQRL